MIQLASSGERAPRPIGQRFSIDPSISLLLMMQLSGVACSGVGRAMIVVAARSIREPIASFMVMGNGEKVKCTSELD